MPDLCTCFHRNKNQKMFEEIKKKDKDKIKILCTSQRELIDRGQSSVWVVLECTWETPVSEPDPLNTVPVGARMQLLLWHLGFVECI